MYIEVTTPIRGRKCTVCHRQIQPGTKHLMTTEFIKDVKYPMKRNVCLECAGEISNPAFLNCMIRLVERLKGIQYKLHKVTNGQ